MNAPFLVPTNTRILLMIFSCFFLRNGQFRLLALSPASSPMQSVAAYLERNEVCPCWSDNPLDQCEIFSTWPSCPDRTSSGSPRQRRKPASARSDETRESHN